MFLLAYVGNNLLYTLYLKHKVIADVMSISIGFMIRFIAGAYIINVEPSRWLLVCGFALSLFLAFGKRRTELEIITSDVRASDIRPTLETYSKEKLNSALAVVNSLCILAYLLYPLIYEYITGKELSDGYYMVWIFLFFIGLGVLFYYIRILLELSEIFQYSWRWWGNVVDWWGTPI